MLSRSQQQSAIADPQFGTSLARYPYRSSAGIDKDIEKTMFHIADRRLLIADVLSATSLQQRFQGLHHDVGHESVAVGVGMDQIWQSVFGITGHTFEEEWD